MAIVADSTPISASPVSASPAATVPGRGATRSAGQLAHRLELRVQPGDDCTLVQIWGEVYTTRLGELTGLLDRQVRQGRTRIVLDISRLYDLDGDAICELTRWRGALAACGGFLWLAAPRPWVRRLLDHMCLRGTFTVFPTVADALAELARPFSAGANAAPASAVTAG